MKQSRQRPCCRWLSQSRHVADHVTVVSIPLPDTQLTIVEVSLSLSLSVCVCVCVCVCQTKTLNSKTVEGANRARYTLVTKSTVAKTGDKSATKSTVADTVDFVANMVDFVAGFGDKSATI